MWINFQPLTAVAGFRDPGLGVVRGGYSSLTMNRDVVGVYLIALEMEKQVVYKLLFISVARGRNMSQGREPEHHLI